MRRKISLCIYMQTKFQPTQCIHFSPNHFGMSNNAPASHQAQYMSIGTGNEEEGCANEMLYDEGDDDVESGM